MGKTLKERSIKKYLSLSIIVLIMLISYLYIYKINFIKDENIFKVENGSIDLSSWDLQETINLDGQWEFYPNQLINPEKEDFDKYRDIVQYIEVPGSWAPHFNDQAEGSGTYRLKIRLPKENIYGVKTRTIRLANQVFINGDEILSTGKPATNTNDFIADSKYKIGFGKSQDREIELVILVSSYRYRTGGIIKPIEFGDAGEILRKDRLDRSIDGFIISICIVLGLYFFLTFLNRGKEVYLAYFSGTSLFMALYLSTMNDQFLNLLVKYEFVGRTKIQTFAMIMTTVCVLRFTYYFFKEHLESRITNIISIGLLLNLCFILIRTDGSSDYIKYSRITQPVIGVSMIIAYTYISYILFRVLYKKIDSSVYVGIIVACLYSYWLTLILKMFFELDLGYLPVGLISTMMISVALLMSHRQQLDYQEVVSLTNKLVTFDNVKNEFLGKAANEIRQPMLGIMNLTERLIQGEQGPLNERQQKDLIHINNEGKRIRSLVESLIEVSQVNKEETSLKVEEVGSYSVIEDLLAEMQLLIVEDKDIVLKNKVDKKTETIAVDRDKFNQLIYNLVHNSIKYTDRGVIEVSAHRKGNYIVFEVKDTGIGIAEEDIGEIFDIFYQKRRDEDSKIGLGLGLAIVKQIVKSHGGEIEVESSLGEGTSFKFTMPIYDSTIVQENDNEIELNKDIVINKKEDKRNYESDRILLVDGGAGHRHEIVEQIQELDLEILLASSAMEAMEIIDREKVDLIVLDLALSDISGDKLCREIRKKYSLIELPILFLTSSGRNMDIRIAFECGANDYVKKPVKKEELKSRIQSLLMMKSSVEEGLTKEFQYFYSQISPHFLYNTINTIIGLSYEDTDLAREALNNLSVYLRGKLDYHRNHSLISLSNELDLVRAYLEIEELRYGDRLRVEYDIEEDIRVKIPPLTLQPIIENAIHHGLAKKEGGGWIKIQVGKREDGYIDISIEDNGLGMSEEKQKELLEGKSERIGFRNIVEKLKILKGTSIKIDSQIDVGTKITISLKEVKAIESHIS